MAEKIEVVFLDETPAAADPRLADTVDAAPHRRPGPSADAANDSVPQGPRKRWKGEPRDESPRASTKGPRKPRDDESPAVGQDAARAAEILAKALGLGALAATVKQLADSFASLWKAVNQSTAAHESNAASVERAKQAASGASTGPTAGGSSMPEAIDAEFEVNNSPDIPKLPGPRGLSTRHAQTTIETVAVRGPVSATTVAGPAASGGSLAAAAGPLAIAFAATTAAVIAGGVAFKKFFDFVESESDRLSNFSAPLAGATARSDIRAELADIRRANQIGPQLARFEDLRGRANEKMIDLQTALLKELLQLADLLAPAIEAGLDLAEIVTEHTPTIVSLLKGGILESKAGTAAVSGALLGGVIPFLTKLLKIAKERKDDEFDPDDMFLRDFQAMFPRAAPGFPAFPKPAAGGLP